MQLDYSKSKKYYEWFKKEHPNHDAHHLVGTKVTDYLLVPLTREEHQVPHKKPDEYFQEDLIIAINILSNYIKSIEVEE